MRLVFIRQTATIPKTAMYTGIPRKNHPGSQGRKPVGHQESQKEKGRRHLARGPLSNKLPDKSHYARHSDRIRVVNHESVRTRHLDIHKVAVIQVDNVGARNAAKARGDGGRRW